MNDGGVGMIQVLGGRFFDNLGSEIGSGGGVLFQFVLIDVSGFDFRLWNVKLEVVCDVDNLLIGLKGVMVVFGL